MPDITALPYTISSSGTYDVTADLTAAGTAITLNADNVVIRGQGGVRKTITYADSAGGHGVVAAGNRTNITIEDLNFVKGAFEPTNVSGDQSDGVRFALNFTNLLIQRCGFTVGRGGTVGSTGTCHGVRLNGFTLTTCSLTIDACDFSLVGVSATDNSAGRCLSIDGSAAARIAGEVKNCTFTLNNFKSLPGGYPSILYVDVQNTAYTFTMHDCTATIGSTADTAQGVTTWNTTFFEFYRWTINCAGAQSRPVIFNGTSNDNIFRDSVVTMTNTTEATQSSGLRTRYYAKRNQFYRNTIDCSASTRSYCIYAGGQETTTGFEPSEANVWRDNVFKGSTTLETVRVFEGSLNDWFYYNTWQNNTPGQTTRDLFIGTTNATNGNVSGLKFAYERGINKVEGTQGVGTTVEVTFCNCDHRNGTDMAAGDIVIAGATVTVTNVAGACMVGPPPAAGGGLSGLSGLTCP